MEPRLVPVNAWIASLTGKGGWPAPLGEQGFRLERLELPVTTSASTVVVDGLAISQRNRVILVCEAKSGENVEPAQAEKYRVMTPREVGRLQSLPFASDDATLCPMYSCLEPAAARIRKGLDAAGLDCPLLVVARGRSAWTRVPRHHSKRSTSRWIRRHRALSSSTPRAPTASSRSC